MLAYLASAIVAVSLTDFKVGRQWTWDYFRDQQLYSSERYTVTSVQGASVTIEMSTRLPGETAFRLHHRLIVPVDRCLAAYSPVGRVRPWSFRMQNLEGGRWVDVKPRSTLAFEEKFNCNPFVHDSREYLTVIREDGVFQHRRWRRVEGSWFGADGVAVEKDFGHGYRSRRFTDQPSPVVLIRYPRAM